MLLSGAPSESAHGWRCLTIQHPQAAKGGGGAEFGVCPTLACCWGLRKAGQALTVNCQEQKSVLSVWQAEPQCY